MPADIRLRLWETGEYSLTSEGADGSRSVVRLHANGVVSTQEIAADGSGRAEFVLAVDDGIQFVFTAAPTDVPRPGYDRVVRGELDGPWTSGSVIDRGLPDGGHIKVTRDGDGTGHYWEAGSRTAGVDAEGWMHPGRDWVTSFHPSRDLQHPGGSGHQESTEWGTVHDPSGQDRHYTTATVTTRDEAGRVVSRVWESASYSANGDRDHGAGVTNASGGSVTWSNTSEDGSWRITTITTDEHGDGTRHTTSGKGDEVTGDETTPEHRDPNDTDVHENPDPPDEAPSGDGADDGHEGNPDAGFDSVSLRRLIGDDWRGPEDLDALGDVEARLRPWLDRLAATLASGAGGGGEELLDTLGAPPFAGLDLTGVHHDALEELDALGRPRPIIDTILEPATVVIGQEETSAASIRHLQTVAEVFATTVSLAARSVALLQHR
jgi:hypothetical protein